MHSKRFKMADTTKRAWTLVELLVVIIVLSALVVILIPLILQGRESSRRMQCQNNLKQLAISVHSFHDAMKVLPKANFQPQFCQEKFFDETTGRYGNRELYGVLPVLMPYLESNPYFNILMTQFRKDGDAPTPWDERWASEIGSNIYARTHVHQMQSPTFLCPNDTFAGKKTAGDLGRTNYHGCRGDLWVDWKPKTNRGIFVSGPGEPISFKDVPDGLSNTILFGECVVGNNHGGENAPIRGGLAYGMPFGPEAVPARCLERAGKDGKLTGEQNHDVLTNSKGSGLCWLSGVQVHSQFFTILPPNAPSCSSETGWQDWAMNTASSFHPKGCNVGMADGSVTFVNNDIDCGDLSKTFVEFTKLPPPDVDYRDSPWGIWGWMGSRDGYGKMLKTDDLR